MDYELPIIHLESLSGRRDCHIDGNNMTIALSWTLR
jgi:hypothetical protein